MAGKNRKDNNSKKSDSNKVKEIAVQETTQIHDDEFNSGFSNYLKSSQGESYIQKFYFNFHIFFKNYF